MTRNGDGRYKNSQYRVLGGNILGAKTRNGDGGIKIARESKILKVGDMAPDFRLPDASTGEEVGLGDLMGRPLLVYFGRGTW